MQVAVDAVVRYSGGTPLELGGSLGRESATGRGLLCAAECLFEDLGKKVSDFTYAVQGFGNDGMTYLLRFAALEGTTGELRNMVENTLKAHLDGTGVTIQREELVAEFQPHRHRVVRVDVERPLALLPVVRGPLLSQRAEFCGVVDAQVDVDAPAAAMLDRVVGERVVAFDGR